MPVPPDPSMRMPRLRQKSTTQVVPVAPSHGTCQARRLRKGFGTACGAAPMCARTWSWKFLRRASFFWAFSTSSSKRHHSFRLDSRLLVGLQARFSRDTWEVPDSRGRPRGARLGPHRSQVLDQQSCLGLRGKLGQLWSGFGHFAVPTNVGTHDWHGC